MTNKDTARTASIVVTILVVAFVMLILSLVNVVKQREIEERGQSIDEVASSQPTNSWTVAEKCDGFNVNFTRTIISKEEFYCCMKAAEVDEDIAIIVIKPSDDDKDAKVIEGTEPVLTGISYIRATMKDCNAKAKHMLLSMQADYYIGIINQNMHQTAYFLYVNKSSVASYDCRAINTVTNRGKYESKKREVISFITEGNE